MTNQEILEKAIKKAIDGGWDAMGWVDFTPIHAYGVLVGFRNKWDDTALTLRINDIIFNHDFCKAIFGTNEVCFNCGLEGKHDPYCAEQTFYDEAWKYRLREMVLEENPVKYLEDYV